MENIQNTLENTTINETEENTMVNEQNTIAIETTNENEAYVVMLMEITMNLRISARNLLEKLLLKGWDIHQLILLWICTHMLLLICRRMLLIKLRMEYSIN